MEHYKLVFIDEQGNEESTQIESDDLRYLTSEARDLQRILPKERKDDHCYYAVFDGITLIYSAYGY
jgi:hypothetical protein